MKTVMLSIVCAFALLQNLSFSKENTGSGLPSKNEHKHVWYSFKGFELDQPRDKVDALARSNKMIVKGSNNASVCYLPSSLTSTNLCVLGKIKGVPVRLQSLSFLFKNDKCSGIRIAAEEGPSNELLDHILLFETAIINVFGLMQKEKDYTVEEYKGRSEIEAALWSFKDFSISISGCISSNKCAAVLYIQSNGPVSYDKILKKDVVPNF